MKKTKRHSLKKFIFLKQNITPLHVATKWGKANSVNLLLDNGAKIDVKTRVIKY
jgi:hypothetical protein